MAGGKPPDPIYWMVMAKSDNPMVPQHLGLILDGNRRWAKANNKSVAEGHREGYVNLKRLVKWSVKYGVRYVSAYVFSTENWQRDRQEVRDIMKLLRWVLKHEVKELNRNGIRLRVVGSKVKLGAAMLRAIHQAEVETRDNTRGTLLLCLDYGGQQEIVDAVKSIAASGIMPEEITPDLISHHLYAPDVPPLDLVIRTSGEQRLSNFMLWESAYSELYFPDKYWPDFDEAALKLAIDDYAKRHRRFGK
jgi:undecaprenyl diphosphate synthase